MADNNIKIALAKKVFDTVRVLTTYDSFEGYQIEAVGQDSLEIVVRARSFSGSGPRYFKIKISEML